jgi:lipoic acid synthetase
MGIRHCVITSVDRDDLEDQGAGHWVKTIRELKRVHPGLAIEVLIPDFRGDTELIRMVAGAGPDIMSHNLETVERLTPFIRSAAKYRRSLDVIRCVSSAGVVPKSGIMLGLGETHQEILNTMDDLRRAGCKVMTIGQYLAPTKSHLPVTDYFPPSYFRSLRETALEKGFRHVESGPLVRSSYHAEEHIHS